MASPDPGAGTTDGSRERPKLKLAPRNENNAAKLDMERQSSSKNPFGAARPREEILASKLGLSEEDILKEEARKTKVHLKLTKEQQEQQKAAEDAVEEITDQIAKEEDPSKKETLEAELVDRQEKLDKLVDHFAKLHFEAAQKGQIERPSQRRQQQQHQQPPERTYSGGRGGYQSGYGGRSGSIDRNYSGGYQSGKGGYGGRGGDGYGGRDSYEGGNGGSAIAYGSYESRGGSGYGGARGGGFDYVGGREGSQPDFQGSRSGEYGDPGYERGGGRGRGRGGRGRAGYGGEYEDYRGGYGEQNGGFGYDSTYEYQSPYSKPSDRY